MYQHGKIVGDAWADTWELAIITGWLRSYDEMLYNY